jgi:hypothetical protein
VHPDNGRALQILESIARAPRDTGAVPLSPLYLKAVERLERLPQSQPGTDKTWVLSTLRSSSTLLANARRLR